MHDVANRYERSLRSLLWRLRPRRLQLLVDRLMTKGPPANAAGSDPVVAWRQLHDRCRRCVIERLVRQRQAERVRPFPDATWQRRAEQQTRTRLESSIPAQPVAGSPDFHCDSGLGGLARWLRAAGYDARFWPRIADGELVRETLHSDAILLTTDRPLMERSVIVWGVVPALLVPLEVGKHCQFEFVASRLGLRRRTSRCMSCGGALVQVAKEAVRDRIPPRTYPWRDDYYLCDRCGRLFWHGTHWHNVQRQLDELLDRPSQD